MWEQPKEPDIDPGRLAWHEMTFDLVDARCSPGVQWAEAKLAAGEGPLSGDGVPVQDREYLIYAKVPGDNRWLHVAGWLPTHRLIAQSSRLRGHS